MSRTTFRIGLWKGGAVGLCAAAWVLSPISAATTAVAATPPVLASTTTPIKHLVVIYGENVSFDHYFATYPNAKNTAGEPAFTAASGTPAVNGLTPSEASGGRDLLINNPNGADPQRLDPRDPSDVLTCDQSHAYTAEQEAFDGGKMDKFPSAVGNGTGRSPTGQACNADTDLDYYDGNTVTGLWNYAQHFAMDDNFFGTAFGPSTPGAINLVSGDTDGVGLVDSTSGTPNSAVVPDGVGGKALLADTDPYYDDCSSTTSNASMRGQNVGNLLNAAGVSWGWFSGGFAPTITYGGPSNNPGSYNPAKVEERAVCGTAHPVGAAIGGSGATGSHPYGMTADYQAHHEPFQYYASTANPHHLAPKSLTAIGTDTQSYTDGKPDFNTANHQYDISAFNAVLAAITAGVESPNYLPGVSFLKAPSYEDGHAGYSDPLDEQHFLTTEINAIEKSPDWSSTAIILAWDDSDGWYDHVYSGAENGGQPQNSSHSPADVLTGPGSCGKAAASYNGAAGRCGYGPRLPLLVISPYAKANDVDSAMTDQSSILAFIQQNWKLGSIKDSAASKAGSITGMLDFGRSGQSVGSAARQPLFLSPVTGEEVPAKAAVVALPLPIPSHHDSAHLLATYLAAALGIALVAGFVLVVAWNRWFRRRTSMP